MPTIQTTDCNMTHICGNNKCYWKQRDCFGLQPFAMYYDGNGNMPGVISNDKVIAKYGQPFFPKLSCSVGINCLHIVCSDFQTKVKDDGNI